MEVKTVTIFIADCGKKYWSKPGCKGHEKNCKCWANPKFKTCKTCDFSQGFYANEVETWRGIYCENSAFDYDKHFTPAHEKAPDLCINCPVWVSKDN